MKVSSHIHIQYLGFFMWTINDVFHFHNLFHFHNVFNYRAEKTKWMDILRERHTEGQEHS